MATTVVGRGGRGFPILHTIFAFQFLYLLHLELVPESCCQICAGRLTLGGKENPSADVRRALEHYRTVRGNADNGFRVEDVFDKDDPYPMSA